MTPDDVLARFEGDLHRRTRFVRTTAAVSMPHSPDLIRTVEAPGLTRGYVQEIAHRLLSDVSRFDFPPYRSAWCDSKANLADQSELSPHLIVNFSSTNQRADSF
jgi:hypothetical protein